MKRVARQIYRWGTVLMFLLIIVQFTTAGAGVFSAMAGNSQGTEALDFHALGALVIVVVSLLMVIAAFAGRLPWRMTGLAASFVPLLFLQAIFIAPFVAPNDSFTTSIGASDKPWLSALHVLNALFIFWLAIRWVEWTRRDLELMGRAGLSARVDLPAAGSLTQ
ncbi:MAG TPA: DUF6220 domain-containing protein [Candidatus Dormibacteraeota bacterium]